jgi:hypothetical protein
VAEWLKAPDSVSAVGNLISFEIPHLFQASAVAMTIKFKIAHPNLPSVAAKVIL